MSSETYILIAIAVLAIWLLRRLTASGRDLYVRGRDLYDLKRSQGRSGSSVAVRDSISTGHWQDQARGDWSSTEKEYIGKLDTLPQLGYFGRQDLANQDLETAQQALTHKSFEIRMHAARFLFRLDPEGSREQLLLLFLDTNRKVRALISREWTFRWRWSDIEYLRALRPEWFVFQRMKSAPNDYRLLQALEWYANLKSEQEQENRPSESRRIEIRKVESVLLRFRKGGLLRRPSIITSTIWDRIEALKEELDIRDAG